MNDFFVLFCITLYCTVSDSCDFVLRCIYSFSDNCIQLDDGQIRNGPKM